MFQLKSTFNLTKLNDKFSLMINKMLQDLQTLPKYFLLLKNLNLEVHHLYEV